MELKQLIFQAKLRSSWQVYDLTQLMLKQFGIKVFIIWAVLAWPIALVVAAVADPVIAGYIIWWLKPIFERPLLYFYSKAVFAEPVTVKQALNSLRRINWRDWLRILTWHRLRWRRAYLAPVDQLEQLSGDKRQRREKVLLRFNKDQQGFWLMFCLHLESLIVLVIASMLWALLPQGWAPEWTLLFDEQQWLSWLFMCLYIIAMGLVAPLFTLGGFLIYLNRRIELEAWDLELAFKTLLSRLRPVLSSIMLACILLMNTQTPLYASEQHHNVADEVPASVGQEATGEQEASAEHKAIAEQVAQIYQQNELIETNTRWQIKAKPEQKAEGLGFWIALLTWLGKGIGYLAWGGVLVIMVVLVVWLYRNSHRLGLRRQAPPISTGSATPLFFADIPQQADAQQLLQLARQYQEAGEYRMALACMLRAALELIQLKYPVVLSADMTEQECLASLQRQLPPLYADVFQRLFSRWIASAWAHQTVATVELLNMLSQLQQWLPEQEAAE